MNSPSVRKSKSYLSGDKYRISVLTDQLIRLEYAEDGIFEDRPTQFAQNRFFDEVEFCYWKTENGLEIRTGSMNIFYNEKPFSAAGLWAENRAACGGIYCTWHYGDPKHENLGGTVRTLDEVDGEIETDAGILSRLCGYSVIDDSCTPVLTDDGWYMPRNGNDRDIYLFFYGYQYKQALRDYFHLTGFTPLLPRFVFGNWWSRYHAYSDMEYLALMERFSENEIPLTVAVIDMDWHITDAGQENKGWTGYTWNRDLFPEPREFLDKLHKRGLKTTLNLHPAEGVQAHEEQYSAAAAVLNKDEENHQRVCFDVSNRAFMETYFNDIHRPLEEAGVDFWWIDWQQGKVTTAEQVDPQWVLNHYHTLHAGNDNRRAVILSRYCGPGSHRYPIGFSGDSVISWRTLDFQPKFTSMASNIGYGWWSHDIGGHTHGIRDDELQTRWVQFGVFSPVMRLHSTSNRFNGKEPWRYPEPYRSIMTQYLQLRHKLIPYIYTMNWLCHSEGEMLIQPMYYAYPEKDEAYRVPNQYFFGTQLIVLPVTTPQDPGLQMGSATAWLPEGTYYDIFTDIRYTGDRMLKVFRRIDSIPVFAKAGSILILDQNTRNDNSVMNPDGLDVEVFSGDDGVFELYEDDGETKAFETGDYHLTEFRYSEDQEGCTLKITTGKEKTYLPARRNFRLRFHGMSDHQNISVRSDNRNCHFTTNYSAHKNVLEVIVNNIRQGASVVVKINSMRVAPGNHTLEYQESILNYAHIEYELKDRIYRILTSDHQHLHMISELSALDLPAGLLEALIEPMD